MRTWPEIVFEYQRFWRNVLRKINMKQIDLFIQVIIVSFLKYQPTLGFLKVGLSAKLNCIENIPGVCSVCKCTWIPEQGKWLHIKSTLIKTPSKNLPEDQLRCVWKRTRPKAIILPLIFPFEIKPQRVRVRESKKGEKTKACITLFGGEHGMQQHQNPRHFYFHM